MSIKASIDIEFLRPVEPKKILLELTGSGWELGFHGEVLFLNASDHENYDWQVSVLEEFDFNKFLESHSPSDRIGISMVFDGMHGGEFIIFENWMSFSISINKVFLSRKIPDFSIYLGRLIGAIEGFDISTIKCECVF